MTDDDLTALLAAGDGTGGGARGRQDAVNEHGPRRRIVDRAHGYGRMNDALLLSCGHVYFAVPFSRLSQAKTTTCEKCRDGITIDQWSDWK